MKKRMNKKEPGELHTFFLACELKPKSELWSVIDPFAYDVRPAFIYGTLGIINYDPVGYSILEIDNKQPLLGYVMTITHPETVLLLDKMKGFNGPEAFNCHFRRKVHAYVDIDEVIDAWCYLMSDYVLECYSKMEQIEFGLHDDTDEQQIALLEKIEHAD